MSKEKRYWVTTGNYIHARNDREAKVKAAKVAEFIQTLDDNQAKVISLETAPFASFHSEMIHKGTLTLFENKLIEV